MEVRYVASRYPRPSADGGGGNSLTDGRIYTVLELSTDTDGRNWLRIECDNGTPALFDSRCFMVTDERVLPTWTVELLDNSSVTIGPREFQQDRLWERFFDRDPAAEAVYADVLGHPRRW